MTNPVLNDKVAARIKHLRRKFGHTQETLAEKADVSAQHIQRLEGKKPCGCSVATIEKIASAFNISLSKFFEDI